MATQDPTTNYSWNLPANGGDPGAWGTMINTIIGDDSTGIDAVVKAVSDVADAALPKAGGTMTGALTLLTERHTAVDLGSSLTGTVTCDLSLANVFYGTCTGNVTIAFSNIPSNVPVFVTIELTTSSTPHTISWPSGTTFGADSLKTLSATTTQVFFLFSRNSGTDWRAAHLANMTP